MTKKNSGRDGKPLSRKTIWALIAAGCALLAAGTAVLVLVLGGKDGGPEAGGGLLAEISGWSGYCRTVSQEEYDFFYGQVERNLYADQEGADVDQLTRDYINQVNARFYLGSRLDLCESFDFAVMQYRMDQENAVRQAKLEAGETVYGVTQYTLSTYFSYLDSNLRTDIVDYLIEHADEAMLREAEAYFNAHPSSFEALVSITYTLEHGGQTTTETVDSAGLRTLQNAGGALGEFLSSAQPGEALDYETPDGEAVRAVLVDAVYETPEFKDAVSAAVRTWLNAQVMDGLYETLAQANPVEFAFD